MVATLNGHMPALAPFFIPERYEWIGCDLPDYDGLRVELRVNLRNFELAELGIARRTGNDQRLAVMVAPWIRDWNLYEAGEDGEPAKVPPPTEATEDPFRSLLRCDRLVVTWILDQLEVGFKGGKGSSVGLSTSATEPAPTPEPNASDKPIPKPNSRPSPAKSTGRGR